MIDPVQLAFDISGDVALLAIPALLWALLYVLGWQHNAFAESVGFGRRTFWLLVAGGLLGTIVLLPIAPIANDWLAISYPGAVFPLLVAALAFGRVAPPLRRTLPALLAFVAVEIVVLLALVVFVPPSTTQLVLVLAAAAATPLAAGLASAGAPGRSLGRIATVLALFSGVVVVTFLSSTAIPGVGIEESFPAYLVGPVAAGFVAVAVAHRAFPGAEALALPAAYIASTFGVIVGADVLRQPPLYGTGPSGLYAIGGAGIFDLVYLSGLLGLAGAFLAHRLSGRGYAPVGPVGEPAPTPLGRLARAMRSGVRGSISESIVDSSLAGREAAAQAHRLLGLPPAPADRPWQGLPVPGWIVADQANLDAAARSGSTDGREGYRAFLTARWLVLVGRELGLRRFASIGARIAAFVIDLAIVTLPAAALWVAIVLASPGSLDSIAANLGFNAAVYGYAAIAFLYFVLLEYGAGATLGKRLLRLGVRDRHLERPSFSSALVRNVSKLPTLTILGVGLAVGLLLLLKTGAAATPGFTGGLAIAAGLLEFLAVLAVVLGGIGLFGAIGVLVIGLTPERQRFGDLVAGTWVVRTATGRPAPAPQPAPARRVPGPSG
ncbi:MAG TPA: RDD family protein [Thermoplasmata archaeon]|nr:RDD family protein [Thermoplasmata archaeon]